MTPAQHAQRIEDALTYSRHWNRAFSCDCSRCKRHMRRMNVEMQLHDKIMREPCNMIRRQFANFN